MLTASRPSASRMRIAAATMASRPSGRRGGAVLRGRRPGGVGMPAGTVSLLTRILSRYILTSRCRDISSLLARDYASRLAADEHRTEYEHRTRCEHRAISTNTVLDRNDIPRLEHCSYSRTAFLTPLERS